MYKLSITAILLLTVLFPITTMAATVQLPATGQTSCYNATGTCTDAAAKGQDGVKQPGVAYPQPRFTDNNNGTITDNLTGLVWLKEADCYISNDGTYYYPTNASYFDTTLSSAKRLKDGKCGLTDNSIEGQWRVPNRIELASLINYNNADNAAWLNLQGFSNIKDSYYFSSTTPYNYGGRSYQYMVNLGKGTIIKDYGLGNTLFLRNK